MKSFREKDFVVFHGFMKTAKGLTYVSTCVEHSITNAKLFTYYIFRLHNHKTFHIYSTQRLIHGVYAQT